MKWLPAEEAQSGTGVRPRLAKEEKISLAAKLLILYAIAAAITPEFEFMGIPKVRITDLLMPFLLFVPSPPRAGRRGAAVPFVWILSLILLWDFCDFFMLGRAAFTPGIYYLGKRCIIFLLYWKVASLRLSSKESSLMVQALIFSAPILCYSALVDLGSVTPGDEARGSGIIRQQEQSTAYFLVLVIPIVLSLWTTPSMRGVKSVLLLGTIGMCVVGLLGTGTKGALLLVIFCGTIMIGRDLKNAMPLAFLLVGSAFFAWLYLPDSLTRRFERIETEMGSVWVGMSEGIDALVPETGGNSVADRLVAASDVMHFYIPQSPIWGLGTGYRPLGFCDDFYLTEWVYHGAIGLGLWGIFLLGVLRALLKARRILTDPLETNVATALAITLVAYFIGCLSADIFYLIRPNEALMLMLGVILGRARQVSPDPEVGAEIASSQMPVRRPRIIEFTPQPGSRQQLQELPSCAHL